MSQESKQPYKEFRWI